MKKILQIVGIVVVIIVIAYFIYLASQTGPDSLRDRDYNQLKTSDSDNGNSQPTQVYVSQKNAYALVLPDTWQLLNGDLESEFVEFTNVPSEDASSTNRVDFSVSVANTNATSSSIFLAGFDKERAKVARGNQSVVVLNTALIKISSHEAVLRIEQWNAIDQKVAVAYVISQGHIFMFIAKSPTVGSNELETTLSGILATVVLN